MMSLKSDLPMSQFVVWPGSNLLHLYNSEGGVVWVTWLQKKG